MNILSVTTHDCRYSLRPGEGGDAVHIQPTYAYAVTRLHAAGGITGTGLAFTLGAGNDLVCRAIDALAQPLIGREIESLMAEFGDVIRRMADHPAWRWLGPHKGVVHLALASIVNACWDLWAKSRGVPLWRLLLDLSPESLVATLDLSYLEDVLNAPKALSILRDHLPSRNERTGALETGYPAYDTSAGWFSYEPRQLVENARRAAAAGFSAIKLKIGSPDPRRDLDRACLVRDAVGPDMRIMVDANQAWSLPMALRAGKQLKALNLYWFEEPTHPDDVLGHQALARVLAPLHLAAGEHLPNRVVFKNYFLAKAVHFVQVDAVRVAGVSEFIAVSLMARAFGLPVTPHVGDMGQLHQHLVLFNHVALGQERLFLEHIPHLREHFVNPARIERGHYRTPENPGSGCDLKEIS